MKYFLGLILILFYLPLYSEDIVKIENFRINAEPKQVVFDIEGDILPDYILKYDEAVRMIFLEFSTSKPGTQIKNKIINNKFIKKIQTVSFDNNTDFFISLRENISFKKEIRYNPTRFVLNFSNDNEKKYTVVIDAGHGGRDPGAIGFKKYKEKDIVFSIVKLLKRRLEKKYNVIMTRNRDVFIPLNKRAEISNKANADLFISVHANASKKRSSNGVDVFYYSKKETKYAKEISKFENSVDEKFGVKGEYTDLIVNDIFYHINQEKSAPLARNILKRISEKLSSKARGVFGANFAVLKGSKSPAILVEVGFITNSKEVYKIRQKKYQQKIADAIYSAVLEYFK